ncbi:MULTISPECIES: hydantoinase/oxoprolinase family protein [Pseudonocardia]|uniref:Acetophenone carboxylase gamma subunit n=2 Tax=Pseudonocardia TaxID=1847 RepID=A0A1Y2N0N6_PSEAH|nr:MULTISPECIES: hydantoinase/oxoprolinase family protein [Pseudonocardia]OSY41053.1 Acetophenone carboxylase gamma subunit [Pseudonocardia autotrophica]TDN73819.1 N-methylhydantoinase A [Pseudonocardia autotrophica]BBG04566.1 hydantoinase [Pseudonocardia autotrophica]GEC28944.1 hydantoinase [Pseudonocardia saturnea]
MSRQRVAIDVGGTFTDVCVFDEDGHDVQVTKVPSTPDDPMRAVLDGVARGGIDLRRVSLFSHGTTVATNALITRSFRPAAMVTTHGFRDVIEIRDGTRDDLWDAYADVAPPYIRRRDRFEVPERVDHAGRIVTPLDEPAARELARLLRRRGAQTVAVCFVNSYANPVHEIRMREILEEELPGASVSTSAEILPEIFEHDRFTTTVANAVLAPLVSGYVSRLAEELRDGGYTEDLLLLHSGGGSMTPRTVERYPVRLAASGIAAGAIAARHVAVQCGFPDAIGLDMGGTSTDLSLIHGGSLRMTKEWSVEFGYPIIFPSIEVLTIGAGGGSIAHIDDAGSLRNGPQSAGADPGPACYDGGGQLATNSDANLHLGRLGRSLAGGAKELRPDLAEKALRSTVADPLGLDVDRAAEAVLEVANANMADAVRLISIRRGYDPRGFALVAFGGAGGLHGAEIARELNIPTVIVPPNPGVTSALGCLLVDIRHDLSAMFGGRTDEIDAADLEDAFAGLESEATARMHAEGVADADVVLQRTVSMRYLGQWRSLQVDCGRDGDALGEAVARFHEQHEREHAFRRDDTPVEIYQLGLTAIGTTPKPSFPPHPVATGEPEPDRRRPVHFAGSGWVDTAVYDRDGLRTGHTLDGPAVVEQLDSTTLVPPGSRAEVDEWLNIRIRIAGGTP